MKIQRAIEILQKLKDKHGDIEVFYDCGHCGKSTRPTIIVPVVQLQATPTR